MARQSLLLDISLPFCIIFLCLAGLFFYVAKQQDASAQALTGEGVVAVAKLVDKTTFTSSGIHKYANYTSKGPTSYTLHYQYTLPETGEVKEVTSDVSAEIWNAMQVGEHYEIIYSPKNPEITSLFNGQDFIDGARLAHRIALILLVLALISGGFYWRLKP